MNAECIWLIFSVAGGDVPQPENLEVHMMEGEIVVHWRKPAGAPSNTQYNVQMAKYV